MEGNEQKQEKEYGNSDLEEAAREYLKRELWEDAPRKKPRGTPRDRRPKLKGSPAADAVIEDRR
jgi:hypothetical protein